MRYLSEAIDDFDLVDAVDAGAEAAVHAKYLVVDDDREGEEVEHVGEVVPDVGVAVLAVALGVEAVGLRYASRLVVASDEVHAGRVAEFKADKEGDCLDGEEAAIYVVSWMIENVSKTLMRFQSGESLVLNHNWKALSTRALSWTAHLKKGNWCPDKSHRF